jgi:hypothetical protein
MLGQALRDVVRHGLHGVRLLYELKLWLLL